jgi:hypothetical protein
MAGSRPGSDNRSSIGSGGSEDSSSTADSKNVGAIIIAPEPVSVSDVEEIEELGEAVRK